MRRKLIAGNWKMHGLRRDVDVLLTAIKHGAQTLKQVDIVVFPSFVHIPQAQNNLENTSVVWGAQNIYIGESGAFTGEVSGPMLVDYGCRYVLIGHSERRLLFFEDLPLVAAKFKAAVQCGLQPILCLGETFTQREKNETERTLSEQLESVIESVGIDMFHEALIAYEPIWAIGTGLTATPEQAQAVHTYVRRQIKRHSVDVADTMRILYGGSVKADNAKALFVMPDIDGGLVGGASLNAASFLAIAKAAEM
jgi:triosephosphate isomerase (TIM)